MSLKLASDQQTVKPWTVSAVDRRWSRSDANNRKQQTYLHDLNDVVCGTYVLFFALALYRNQVLSLGDESASPVHGCGTRVGALSAPQRGLKSARAVLIFALGDTTLQILAHEPLFAKTVAI